MRRKSILVFAVFASVLFLLAGCARTDAKETYLKASEELNNRNYEEAETLFQSTIDQGFYYAEAYRGMGITQLMRSMYAEAAISFSKAKLYGDDMTSDFLRDVDEYLAYARLKQGKTEEAKALYDALLAEEDNAEIRYMRGRIYMADGEYSLAEEDFNAAVELSEDYNLYVGIYELYQDYKMDAFGAQFLRKALEIAEKNEDDHYGRGVIQYYLENYDEAKSELISALRADQNDERAVLLLGKTYLALDNAADARAMYKEYLSNPNCAAASYNGLALCDLKEGNYDKALQNIQSGLACNDDTVNESLLYNEIIVYEQKSDWETAKIKAASFAAQFPTNEAGQREYAFLSNR